MFPVGSSKLMRSFPLIVSTYFFMVEIFRSLQRFSIAESEGCFIPKVVASFF